MKSHAPEQRDKLRALKIIGNTIAMSFGERVKAVARVGCEPATLSLARSQYY